LFGLSITAIGIPLYWYFKQQKSKEKEAITIIQGTETVLIEKNTLPD